MFKIVCIVEGYGEVEALPVLLRRAVAEVNPCLAIKVEKPIRLPRSKLDKDSELKRAVELAADKAGDCGVVFLLFDADDDCPATKGPEILRKVKAFRSDKTFRVVLANREFESWFISSASSLSTKGKLLPDTISPPNIDDIRDAKGWLNSHMAASTSYSPTVDQPAFAALFDFQQALARSDSFDKFMRDIRSLIEDL